MRTVKNIASLSIKFVTSSAKKRNVKICVLLQIIWLLAQPFPAQMRPWINIYLSNTSLTQ